MTTPPKPDTITQRCLARLAEVAPELDASTISTTASLTEELMLDSFVLASLVEKLEHEFSDVDMTRWLMSATRGGQDTIEGLVSYLVEAQTERG